MTNDLSKAKEARAKIFKIFKIYGIVLWGVFLLAAVVIPSLLGTTEQELKFIATRGFTGLLAAYFIPYYITWKIFEKKHGPVEQLKD